MKSIPIDLNKENMISTFATEEFYESWKVFIRELLQNAIDACEARDALEKSWGAEFLEYEQAKTLSEIRKNYAPKITISYDSVSKLFSIEDNGIGISVSDLEKYVANVGKSYYDSEDFYGQRLNFQAISKHGLGLCSCFMISRGILIESRKDSSINTAWNMSNKQSLEPIMAKWLGSNNSIEYVTGNRKESGTKISLPVIAEYSGKITMDFLVESVKHYLMYQPIPITIKYDDEETVLYQQKMNWRFPHTEVIGTTVIQVDNELLEGYIAIYTEKQKHLFGDSEIFQQNIRVTEHVETLELKPKWIENFTYQLNIKKRLLNMNLARTTAAKDENLRILRQRIGQIVINHFNKSAPTLGQYLSDGRKLILTRFEQENDLISRAIMLRVFFKGKDVEVPLKTVIQGLIGSKMRIAVISRDLFNYYRTGYAYSFNKFANKYDLAVFEQNARMFIQFMTPYITQMRYVIEDTPGVIYTDISADMTYKKEISEYRDKVQLQPDGCDMPNVFCLVSNELTSPMEIILNPYNRNANILLDGECYEKVRRFKAVIVENIKQRILGNLKNWHKIIDFGGECIDEYKSSKALSIKSVWCLEDGFAESINKLIEKTFTPREITQYGLARLYFTDDDFISWWCPPR